MLWAARILLFVPALITGWFLSRDDDNFWVVTLMVGLVILAVTAAVIIYAPIVWAWWKNKD